ncbi:hypothetical protein HXX76_014113 [Chlamydomonas incerta]|uniref:Uncharacterized protein n=1 Tax=Chlamydomonas incerta TaxID=51695 RepID=A0A835SQX4_CHLIN|nr:hypothetical protein HXX76_014113 [Chlamydomonas incerta]|eukprot:KAG2424955.1 hypothetical protein HXX76_014113 [Chlamydomonas incerta]
MEIEEGDIETPSYGDGVATKQQLIDALVQYGLPTAVLEEHSKPMLAKLLEDCRQEEHLRSLIKEELLILERKLLPCPDKVKDLQRVLRDNGVPIDAKAKKQVLQEKLYRLREQRLADTAPEEFPRQCPDRAWQIWPILNKFGGGEGLSLGSKLCNLQQAFIRKRLEIHPLPANEYLDMDTLREICSGHSMPEGASRDDYVAKALEKGLVTQEQVGVPHTRPDRSEKMKATGKNGTLKHFTREMTLGAFSKALDPDYYDTRLFLDTVDTTVKKLSDIAESRSIFLNCVLSSMVGTPEGQAGIETDDFKYAKALHDAATKKAEKSNKVSSTASTSAASAVPAPPVPPLPPEPPNEGLDVLDITFIRCCLTHGQDGSGPTSVAQVRQRLDLWKDAFPSTGLPSYCSNVITHKANEYETNFKLHLYRYDHCVKRITRYITSCVRGPLTAKSARSMAEAAQHGPMLWDPGDMPEVDRAKVRSVASAIFAGLAPDQQRPEQLERLHAYSARILFPNPLMCPKCDRVCRSKIGFRSHTQACKEQRAAAEQPDIDDADARDMEDSVADTASYRVNQVVAAIKSGTAEVLDHPEDQAIVDSIRRLLGLDAGSVASHWADTPGQPVPLSERHLKRIPWRVLHLLKHMDLHMQQQMALMQLIKGAWPDASFRRGAGAGFTLAPMWKGKAHNIKLDNTNICSFIESHKILRPRPLNSKRIDGPRDEFIRSSLRAAVRKHFVGGTGTRRAGDLDALFTGMLETDGVSLKLHFEQRMSKEETERREQKREAKYRTREQQQAWQRKVKAEAKKAKPVPVPGLVLGADIGVKHLVYITVSIRDASGALTTVRIPVQRQPGKPPKTKPLAYHLGAGAYYTQSGVRRRRGLTLRRRAKLKKVDEALAKETRTTTDLAKLLEYARAINGARASRSAFWMSKRSRTTAFRNRIGLRRTLQLFFSRVRSDLRRRFPDLVDSAVLVVGDANFETNIKGCAPVAGTAKVMEAAALFFPVQTGSEYGTSTACAKCKRGYLHTVRMKTAGPLKVIVHSHDPAKPARSVRRGLLHGTHAKRTLRRIDQHQPHLPDGTTAPKARSPSALPEVQRLRRAARKKRQRNKKKDGNKRQQPKRRLKHWSPSVWKDGSKKREVQAEMNYRDIHGANGVIMHFECSCKRVEVAPVFRPEERKRRADERRARARQEAQVQ